MLKVPALLNLAGAQASAGHPDISHKCAGTALLLRTHLRLNKSPRSGVGWPLTFRGSAVHIF